MAIRLGTHGKPRRSLPATRARMFLNQCWIACTVVVYECASLPQTWTLRYESASSRQRSSHQQSSSFAGQSTLRNSPSTSLLKQREQHNEQIGKNKNFFFQISGPHCKRDQITRDSGIVTGDETGIAQQYHKGRKVIAPVIGTIGANNWCNCLEDGRPRDGNATMAAVTLELKKRAKQTKSVYTARTADTGKRTGFHVTAVRAMLTLFVCLARFFM